jgi:surfeit locus 1 family protein
LSAARKVATLGALSVVAVALLALLGFWQLRRLAWKEALIAAVETRAKASAVADDGRWEALTPETDEYRHVSLHGSFERAKSALLFATPLHPRPGAEEPGYLVVTPLRLADGRTVLIDRGFVAASAKDAFLKADASAPAGDVDVTGLMRFSEARHWYSPTDDVANRVFFTRDVGAMAAALGAAGAAPFMIDADASPASAPLVAGQTRIEFPNRHLEYAVTWFGLAAVWAAGFAAYAWSETRSKKGDDRAA